MSDRKGKHLTLNDRLTIERMLLKGYSKKEIADVIGCCLATIYNEVKRATYLHTNRELIDEERYNPDEAQRKYEEQLKRKGVKPKLSRCPKLIQYIEDLMIDLKYSPEAVLMEMNKSNLKFDVTVSSVNTIYSGIRRGYFPNLKMEHLPRGVRKQRKERVRRQKRASQGTSIEKRDKAVLRRDVCGNWEMDCVIGKATDRKTILTLTERKTRYTILEVLKTHTAAEVIKALNRIEKRYGKYFYEIFKSITVDNGSEFADYKGMEKALYRIGARTHIYYCHPHAPHERGSNENGNHLIRRHLSKGTNFDTELNRNKLKDIEFWMNAYPRKLFAGNSSYDLFKKELEALGMEGD